MNRYRIVLLVGFLFILGSGVAYWWSTPRITAVFPREGATDIPSGTNIQVIFSHPMQEQTLKEHLQFEPPMEGSIIFEDHTLVFDPLTNWPAGQTITVTMETGGRSTGFLPVSQRTVKTWSFTIRQPTLLYLYPSNGPSEIFRINPKTGKSQRLTESSGTITDYSVKSAGANIYFSVKNNSGSTEIFMLDLNEFVQAINQDNTQEINQNKSPRRILSCPTSICESPVISPKGDFLAYERTVLIGTEEPGFPQVWYYPISSPDLILTGGSKPVPILAGTPDHETMQPSWSPDGLLTFYDKTASAFIFLDPKNGKTSSFLNQTGQPGDWHPDGTEYVGSEILFNNKNDSLEGPKQDTYLGSHLMQFNLRNGTIKDISNGDNQEDTWPSFSPDGTYLVFARKYLDSQKWTPGRQIWLMKSGINKPQQLTDDPLYNHFAFTWSPEGDQLAFVRFNQSTLNEPTEIWLMDMNTYGITSLVEGGFAPYWIP